jgi:hypothetical protein
MVEEARASIPEIGLEGASKHYRNATIALEGISPSAICMPAIRFAAVDFAAVARINEASPANRKPAQKQHQQNFHHLINPIQQHRRNPRHQRQNDRQPTGQEDSPRGLRQELSQAQAAFLSLRLIPVQ